MQAAYNLLARTQTTRTAWWYRNSGRLVIALCIIAVGMIGGVIIVIVTATFKGWQQDIGRYRSCVQENIKLTQQIEQAAPLSLPLKDIELKEKPECLKRIGRKCRRWENDIPK